MKLPSIAHRILQRIRPISVKMELHTLTDAIRAQDGKRDIRTEKLDKLTTIFNRMSLLPRHIHSGFNGASHKSLNMMSEHYMDLVVIRQELRAAHIVFEEVTLGPKAIMKIDAQLSGMEKKTDDAEAYWQAMYQDNCDSALPVAEQTGKAKLAASLLGSYLHIRPAAAPEPITAPVAQPEPMQDDDTPLAHAFLRHLELREQTNAAAPPSRASDLSWTYEQRAGETPEQHIQRLTSVQPSELSQSFIALAPYAHVPATDRLNLLKTFGLISGIPDLKALKRKRYELDDFPARPQGGAFRSLSSLDIELRQITARINRLNDGQPRRSLLACVEACSARIESARAFWESVLSSAANGDVADENSALHQQLAQKWLGGASDTSIPEDDAWNIGDPLPDEDFSDEEIDTLEPSHGVVPPSKSPASHLFTTPPTSIPYRREVIVADI